MSEHVCYFVYGGAHCKRPVAHSLCRAWIIDGVSVENEVTFMCEECFNEFVKYARDNGTKL